MITRLCVLHATEFSCRSLERTLAGMDDPFLPRPAILGAWRNSLTLPITLQNASFLETP